jgi:hypothetical protein
MKIIKKYFEVLLYSPAISFKVILTKYFYYARLMVTMMKAKT